MSNANFYKDLPSFPDFHGITEDRYFQNVPEDWYVFVTDVKGSTQAIQDGKYKDVNTVGAAAIASVQNAVGDLEFPFVFGGDGASLLVPPHVKDKVERVLRELKTLSVDTFGLELRVGCVPVKDLHKDGVQIKIAKFQLAGKKCVAMFRGGGMSAAEAKVKGEPETYEMRSLANTTPQLKGLSCRWQPIKNKNGKIMSLLVVPRAREDKGAFQTVLRHFDTILNGKIESANPVNVAEMSYKNLRQCFKDEVRYQKSVFSWKFFLRAIEIVFAVLIFKFKIPPLLFNPNKYAQSMSTHSDFRKCDDALRMIIDCSPEQVGKIKSFLQELHERKEIFYGTFESNTALMTCYVEGLGEGEHIHFIDGGDGGYAMAAKQLKAQIMDARKNRAAA